MDRRKYLKTLAVGSLGAGAILQSCDTDKKTDAVKESKTPELGPDRQPEEIKRDHKIVSETFFDEHEMATITLLADIIIPKDEVSGSASEAGVPDFIEFIVKDRPTYQVPVRGGLKWLDLQCMRRYNNAFIKCSAQEQIAMLDDIAYPEKAKPEMSAGVSFFNTMRDLTAMGFFSSKMGIADIGYAGNTPNEWDGVPQDVLDQYGMRYDERTLNESVKFDKTSS